MKSNAIFSHFSERCIDHAITDAFQSILKWIAWKKLFHIFRGKKSKVLLFIFVYFTIKTHLKYENYGDINSKVVYVVCLVGIFFVWVKRKLVNRKTENRLYKCYDMHFDYTQSCSIQYAVVLRTICGSKIEFNRKLLFRSLF